MAVQPLSFSSFKALNDHCFNVTGSKVFPGCGISYKKPSKTTILRSVDETPYYDDDLSNIMNPTYTLFGRNGDQTENEKRYNEPLLNKDKTEYIYLYRVKSNGKKNEYLWYGKYEIVGKTTKLHPDIEGMMRTIIILSLQRL